MVQCSLDHNSGSLTSMRCEDTVRGYLCLKGREEPASGNMKAFIHLREYIYILARYDFQRLKEVPVTTANSKFKA